MAKYTLELRTIHESKNVKVFNFDYDFYDSDLKPLFEKKFIEHYYIDEIGFETIARFHQRLKSKLNKIMPRYKQLYQTELACKDINFMLNKDLKETFIREVDNTSNMTGDSLSKVNGSDNTGFKESNIANGNASLNLNSLTSISQNDNNFNNTNSTNNNVVNKGSQKEETTLLSQGNIGITSSAELLEKWRSTIINIDEMIIEECRDLFMTIF